MLMRKPIYQKLTVTAVLVVSSFLAYQWWVKQRSMRAEDAAAPTAAAAIAKRQVTDGDVPVNAPHGCPGVQDSAAGQADACAGCPNRKVCASGAVDSAMMDVKLVAQKLSDVENIILVLSGKGGVGKSTISSQIAWELERRGKAVGLLDIDICGPSIPKMTGTMDAEVRPFSDGWLPVVKTENLLVMSVGYLLSDADGAVIWRGPKKNGLIKQFLADVYWGNLDYLIVDTPPGTSDEHLSIVTYLKQVAIRGAIIVTTPQEMSLQDVRKEINFCKQTQIPILGVVENMSNSIFSCRNEHATEETCAKMEVPFVGRIDMSDELLCACEEGRRVRDGSASSRQIQRLLETCVLQSQ